MAEALPCDFDVWLKDTLISLNTDDEVYSPYIKGILEGEEDHEDKVEALQGILTGITDKGIDGLCDEILKKWSLSSEEKPVEEPKEEKVDFEAKFARIMTEQAQAVAVSKPSQAKEKNTLKSTILAQYGEISDGESSDREPEVVSGAGAFAVRNVNTEEVVKAEREKREKNKEDSQRKKEKDKEDKAKQKAKEDDRKEKEKKRTQKGERRR